LPTSEPSRGDSQELEIKCNHYESDTKVIEQCVIYVQSLAAYDAGFGVDRTGDADYAGKGRQISKARRRVNRSSAPSS
jgi:hypothetical protein